MLRRKQTGLVSEKNFERFEKLHEVEKREHEDPVFEQREGISMDRLAEIYEAMVHAEDPAILC